MKRFFLLLPVCLFIATTYVHADGDTPPEQPSRDPTTDPSTQPDEPGHGPGWTIPVLPTTTPTPLPSPHIDPPPNPQCHDDCPRTSMKRQDQVDRTDDMQKLLHNGDFFKPKGAGYDYQNPDRLKSGIGGNAGGGGY